MEDHESMERSQRLLTDFSTPKLNYSPEKITELTARGGISEVAEFKSVCDMLQSDERRSSLPPFCGREYEMRVCDYRDVEILPDSIIYADIPYRDTAGYGKTERKNDFDYDSFYLWAENQEAPVFISEYWCPDDRFLCIAEFDRVSTLSPTNNSMRVMEKVFLPNKWKEWWEKHKKPEPPVQKSLFDDI